MVGNRLIVDNVLAALTKSGVLASPRKPALSVAESLALELEQQRLREAIALARAGKRKEALSRFDRGLILLRGAPGTVRARWFSARAFVRLRVRDEAGAHADFVQALAADARTACLGVGDLQDRGRLEPSYFDPCVDRFPEEDSLRVDRGVARFQAGDPAGAESDFRAALLLKPDSKFAAMSLASVLKGRKKAAP